MRQDRLIPINEELAVLAEYDRSNAAARERLAERLGFKNLRSFRTRIQKIRATTGWSAPDRHAIITRLAEEGYSSRQIAAKLGLSRDGLKQIAKRAGIDIIADRVVNNTLAMDHDRVLEATITQATCDDGTLELLDYTELDLEQIPDYITRLRAAINRLNLIRRNLESELKNGHPHQDSATHNDAMDPTSADQAQPSGAT